MKRIIIMIILGVAFIGGLFAWLKDDFQATDALDEHVSAFYRTRGTVPSSTEELAQFEREMNFPPVSLSFRKLEFSDKGQGLIRIVSTRGFILKSESRREFLVGRKLNTNQTSGAIAPQR